MSTPEYIEVKFKEPKIVTKDDCLYFVDNGACYCGQHLRMTARYTGRDISGQKILKITPKVLTECTAAGFIPKCENCGRKAGGKLIEQNV